MAVVIHKPAVNKFQCATHGKQVPQRVVLHDTESHDTKGIRDIAGVYNFWLGQGKGYGAHFVVDAGGNIGQGAQVTQVCWHVENHNTDSVGIEQVGYAWWNLQKWSAREAQLDKVSKLVAWLSFAYQIPLVHSIDKGVCMHRDFTDGTHTDPGANYPFHSVLTRAKWYKSNGWS